MIKPEIDEQAQELNFGNQTRDMSILKRYGIASIGLGLLGILQLFISLFALGYDFYMLCSLNFIFPATGIVLGIAGMKSDKKITPIFGVVLSSLSLLLNTIFLFVIGTAFVIFPY